MTENVNRLLNRNRLKNNNTSFMKMKNNFVNNGYTGALNFKVN